MYDREKKAGGLLHIILPERIRRDDKLSKYADTGIPLLVELMEKRFKSDMDILTVKIFGGAKILKAESDLLNIGKSNEIVTRKILKNMGIKVVAARAGGTKSYKISLDTETGIVQSRILGESVEEY